MAHSMLFKRNWKEAKEEIQKDPKIVGDLFYDWFCRTSSLDNKALKLIPKIDFVFNKLDLDPKEFTVTLKNNCPLCGDLYDSFIIDSVDGRKRIYISPKLGFKAERLKGKCEVSVILYTQETFGITKLTENFDNWQKFKNNINNGNLKGQILEALNG